MSTSRNEIKFRKMNFERFEKDATNLSFGDLRQVNFDLGEREDVGGSGHVGEEVGNEGLGSSGGD